MDDQFVCLWCCAKPDFVVQINNFSNLLLFSVVVHKTGGKKQITKTIKYKLDSSSKRQFAFLILKTIKYFLENYRFCQKYGNDATSRGWGLMFFPSA